MDSYFIAILIGILTYCAMAVDAYINKVSIKSVSFKIPLFVTLLVWVICEFFIKQQPKPVIPTAQIMQRGFYGN